MRVRSILSTAAATCLAAGLVTGCSSTKDNDGGSTAAKPLIGLDYPRSDTDFWNSYIKYVPAVRHRSSAST